MVGSVFKLVGGIIVFVGCEVGTLFAGKLVKAGAVGVKAAIGAAKGAKAAVEATQVTEAVTETVGVAAEVVK